MRVRATRDLTQLATSEFFAVVAEGLNLIAKNVIRLWEGAAILGEQKKDAARVLANMAEEEAAKILILIDAVRCPAMPADRFARQLGRFSDHLAKGLYARACWMRPATLADLQKYLNDTRKEFYLDGPNEVEWIFRNEVIQEREGAFYVDYVAHEDGNTWWDPTFAEISGLDIMEPESVRIAKCFCDAGFFTRESLEIVAKLWRSQQLGADTQVQEICGINRATLELMDSHGLLIEQPVSIYRHVVDEWQFPMYDLDLSLKKVNRATLREQQRSWYPDW